jgi:hypothetical protein
MIELASWPALRDFALSLGLPEVVETTSWGEPCLKAHGKLWVWWSPTAQVPVFKVPFEERDVLLDAVPETFFITPHYQGHALILARPGTLDIDWVRANLIRVWRAQAPKRWLKAWDGAQDKSAP